MKHHEGGGKAWSSHSILQMQGGRLGGTVIMNILGMKAQWHSPLTWHSGILLNTYTIIIVTILKNILHVTLILDGDIILALF